MNHNQINRAASLASAHGAALLSDLQAADASGHAAFSASANCYSVLVIVMPSAPGEGMDGLTDCDRDCLSLLSQAKEPLSAVRVHRKLEKDDVGVWGLITVKRSLAKLRRMGLISNSRRGARGYSLPEASPIVRKAAG